MQDQKILVTGATGEVARAITKSLALTNEVWAMARFTNPAARSDLESIGVRTHAWSLGSDNFDGLPDNFDYVIHAAAAIFEVGSDFDSAIRLNAEGTGLLMQHVRGAKAFLYVSSTHTYSKLEDNSIPRKEGDAVGCFPYYAPSYSIGKVATEAVVRTMCRALQLPVTIGRLGMNYGFGCSGAPDQAFRAMLAGEQLTVPPKGSSWAPLVHNSDIVEQIEPLLKAATIPATIVNWTGDEAVDEREMYEFMAKAAGIVPNFREDPSAGYFGGVADPSKRIGITGPSKRGWKASFVEMLQANFPDLDFTHPA